jgi:hypothetical protein
MDRCLREGRVPLLKDEDESHCMKPIECAPCDDVGGQAGKRAWADAANECHCSLYV